MHTHTHKALPFFFCSRSGINNLQSRTHVEEAPQFRVWERLSPATENVKGVECGQLFDL